MVGAGLFDRFGLGALGEGRIGETGCETVAVLFGGGDGFGQARAFGAEVDRSFERKGDRHVIYDNLRSAIGNMVG